LTGTAPSEGRLGDLYVRHGPRAVRIAYLVTGDADVAEDLVQEAFIRLAGRFADLRNPAAFEAYLRKTVINLARMHARRQRLERTFSAREKSISATTTDPPDVASYLALREALLTLPVRQRAALVLRYYEDLSERQIAEILRCRPGTVKSLTSRGLAALRERTTR
jgi:RNA polymerase sigma-70 factor (sigma-E family)